MSEWILWVVYATDGKYGEMTHVYARDEEHARERARTWIEAHPRLTDYTFKAFPNGFQIVRRRLPGTIRVQEMDMLEEKGK